VSELDCQTYSLKDKVIAISRTRLEEEVSSFLVPRCAISNLQLGSRRIRRRVEFEGVCLCHTGLRG
jgi:hypothetical protein